MDIKIRKVEYNDLEKIVDIQINGWLNSYRGIIDDDILDSMDFNHKIEKIRNNYQIGSFIVATLNNEVVGYCRYSFDNSYSPNYPIDCEITALYVKPEFKYQGIGTKLFNYVVNEFKENNKEKMLVWCLKDNYPSRKFYEKMGGINTYQNSFIKNNKSFPEVGYLYNLKSR